MNILDTQIATIHVEQISIIPLSEPSTPEQIKIFVRTLHNKFNLEALIPVSHADQAYSELLLGGTLDLAQLLESSQFNWMARTDSQPNLLVSGMFDFQQQADGNFLALVTEESTNRIITSVVINKVKQIQAMYKFGLHADLLNPAFFGQSDARFHSDFSSVDFEDLFNLVDLFEDPKINIVDFKLISPNKLELTYKNGLCHPYSIGFVQVLATVVLSVDHGNKLLQVDRIVEQDVVICMNGEDDENHYTLTIEEFLDNIGAEVELGEAIDTETMEKFITNLLTSQNVLNALAHKVFKKD